MNTNKTIQEAGNTLCVDLINGSKKAATFARLVVVTHGADIDAMETDILALVTRHFSKEACKADKARLAAYAAFRGAFVPDRINSYHVDDIGGLLNISFADPDGTPKDSKARFVTCTYRTPEQVEQDAIKANRVESKARADEQHEVEQTAIKADMVRATLTADDIVKLLEGQLPELTTLTPADIVAAWITKLEAKQVLREQNQRAEQATKEANKAKQEASNKREQVKREKADKVHAANKAQGEKEISQRATG
jgi:DNA repair exonuclease SbcCD nuclease subunit